MTVTEQNINAVCERLIDSKLGYRDAARRADDPRLKSLLEDIGGSREDMIAAVGNTIERTGRTVPCKGTFTGSLHRAWMAARHAMSFSHDVNMITECLRGESYLIGKYDRTLKLQELPEDMRALLSGQRVDLMSNLMDIQAMDLALSKA